MRRVLAVHRALTSDIGGGPVLVAQGITVLHYRRGHYAEYLCNDQSNDGEIAYDNMTARCGTLGFHQSDVRTLCTQALLSSFG